MEASYPHPETGFLTSRSPAGYTFDNDKKVKFIEVAREYAEARQLPDFYKICKTLGIVYRTYTDHVIKDEKFAAEINDIKRAVYDGMCNEISIKANTKNGVIANLAVLKYLERGKFAEDQIIISSDHSTIKDFSMHATEAINAEIVE